VDAAMLGSSADRSANDHGPILFSRYHLEMRGWQRGPTSLQCGSSCRTL